MTVAELIDNLATLPPDAVVWVPGPPPVGWVPAATHMILGDWPGLVFLGGTTLTELAHLLTEGRWPQ